MAEQRPVEIDMNEMGMWTMQAPDCPANVLRARLGEKPDSCRSGLSTKAQGTIPLARCKWLVGEIADQDGSPIATCSFADKEGKDG